MGEAKQPPCEMCANQPVDAAGYMAHLDCELAGQCQVVEGGPYRYYVERGKGKVFTPPLMLAVLYYVPKVLQGDSGLASVELRMQEVKTLRELKEIEAQVARAHPNSKAYEELRKTEHLARFALPLDRQLLIHIMQHLGLLSR